MVRTDRERLLGRVEVDEAFVGGQEEGARGRDAEGKTAVLVAVEGESGKKLGRVRFRCVKSIDRKSVESFILDYMEPGALVVTDALSVHDQLQAMGFVHRPHVVSTGGKEALQELDHVHLIISLLKRWLGGAAYAVKWSPFALGTAQGGQGFQDFGDFFGRSGLSLWSRCSTGKP